MQLTCDRRCLCWVAIPRNQLTKRLRKYTGTVDTPSNPSRKWLARSAAALHVRRCTHSSHCWRPSSSHLLRLLLFFFIVIVVVILVLLSLLVTLSLLGIILLLLLGCLRLTECLPLLDKGICFSHIISDDHVVKDGASLHLPQIKTDEAEVVVLVHRIVIDEFRVGNLLRLPDTLVGRIGDALDRPITLVSRIILHGRLPLAILLVIPIVWLLRLFIDHPLLISPVIGLLVLRVFHHGIVHPIRRLFVIWIRDLLGGQKLPILLQGSLVDLLLVDLHPHRVVRLHDQPVHMRGSVVLLLICNSS